MKVVFLDRDGVINKSPGDADYVKSWEEFKLLPKVKQSIRRMKLAGFKVVVISNQAGVGKGVMDQETLDYITENMLRQLEKTGAIVDGVYYCTHRSEDNCDCRKPKTGLVEKAIAQLKAQGHEVDRKGSFLIGDTIRDVRTGKSAGVNTILIFSGKEKPANKDSWEVLPDFTADDIVGATRIILK